MINDEEKYFDMLNDKFNKARNQQLREIFKKWINPSYLIRVKQDIQKSFEFSMLIPQIYCFDFNNMFKSLGFDDIDYDIAVNLSMIFWELTLFEDDEFKRKLYRDSDFEKNLKERTILQCKLRQLNLKTGKSTIQITHAPLYYIINCSCNYMIDYLEELYQTKKNLNINNEIFKRNMLNFMLKTIKSILLLTSNYDFGNAFSLLRSLLEMYAVYYVIDDNKEYADLYYQFSQYRYDYDRTGEVSENLKDKIRDNNLSNYLNYGWLDSIGNKHNKYVFYELVKYMEYDRDKERHYLDSYQYCCKYVHGNYSVFCLYDFIWIWIEVAQILSEVIVDFKRIFNKDFIYFDIDLHKLLKDYTEEMKLIYQKMENLDEKE